MQGMHNGIDWATPVGTQLVAVCNGQIVHAGLNSPFAAGPRRSVSHLPFFSTDLSKVSFSVAVLGTSSTAM